VSARHVAFLETGRSRPSREMVLMLGEALGMPRGERNRLLDSAGFAAIWKRRPLDSEEMKPVSRAIGHMMRRHEPYPAFAFDRHWVIKGANRTGTLLLSALGVGEGGSLIDALLIPGRAAGMIDNWPEVAAHLLARLKTESLHAGGDAVLDEAAARLADDPALARSQHHADMPPVIPARYRLGGEVFSVFSTIAQFGTAEDIALADLRIELFFPADDATETLFSSMAEAD
jgi:MmyB-like transcription regulator ligand binding domain